LCLTPFQRTTENSNLKKLWLINCDFNEHDFLSFSPESSLETVSVQNSSVTESFVDYVKHLKNLRFLDVSFTLINDSAVEKLIKMQLHELIIESTGITTEGVKKLHLANPDILIEYDCEQL
jgi:hypothetical protein